MHIGFPFCPAYCIPHGTGKINESSIEFVIPCPESPFRDIFKYVDARDSWKLLIKLYSIDTNTCSKFASYENNKNDFKSIY
jgi:hypothetical protein